MTEKILPPDSICFEVPCTSDGGGCDARSEDERIQLDCTRKYQEWIVDASELSNLYLLLDMTCAAIASTAGVHRATPSRWRDAFYEKIRAAYALTLACVAHPHFVHKKPFALDVKTGVPLSRAVVEVEADHQTEYHTVPSVEELTSDFQAKVPKVLDSRIRKLFLAGWVRGRRYFSGVCRIVPKKEPNAALSSPDHDATVLSLHPRKMVGVIASNKRRAA